MREPLQRPRLGQQGLCKVPQSSCITPVLCFHELLPVRLRAAQRKGGVNVTFHSPERKEGLGEESKIRCPVGCRGVRLSRRAPLQPLLLASTTDPAAKAGSEQEMD